MKICSKCKVEKKLTEFNRTKTNKDGLSYLCRECNLEQSRKYRKANKDKYYNDQQRKRETKPVFLSQLLYNAKTRAVKKNIEFDLTKEFLEELLDSSEMKCSVTGLEMNLECHSRKKANPFKCSIDRIDSSRGYLQDNVRFVCWAVNQMKADRTDEELKFWVESIYKAISSQA
jgi:hypothetical protein